MKTDFPQLDSKCANIFTILTLKGELRFKELKKNIDMNEATLLIHLNHLIKHKLVTKKVLSHKNVTYKPNIKKLEEFKTHVESFAETQKEIVKTKETFFDTPINEQLNSVMIWYLKQYLEALKYKILFLKYKRFEDRLLIDLFESQSFRLLENLMLKKCLEETEYMKHVLEAIKLERKKWGIKNYED